MKFVTIRDLRLKPGNVWKMAQQEKDLILTSNGRPVAILTGINEDNLEEELQAIRKARVLQNLERVHRDADIKGLSKISDNEIQAEIDSVRKGRSS